MRFVPLSIIIWLTLFLWLIKWVPVAKKIRKNGLSNPRRFALSGLSEDRGPKDGPTFRDDSHHVCYSCDCRHADICSTFCSLPVYGISAQSHDRCGLFWLRKEVSRLFCRLFPKAKEVGGFHCRETRISRSNNCSLMVYHLCRQMLSRHASFSAF